MWATPAPGGERLLVAGSQETADFVSSVYRFDTVLVSPLRSRLADDRRRLDLHAPGLGLELHLRAGPGWRIPFARPATVTRVVEAPVARRLLGVRTYGTSPTGVREWYRASSYRPVVGGWASLAGVDLGPLGPVDPPVGVGFSEPPRRPSLVEVRPLLRFPRPARG